MKRIHPKTLFPRLRHAVHEVDAEECGNGFHWDEFAAYDGSGSELLRILDPEARVRASATKLLAALQAILPYAEAEAEALQDLRHGDEIAGEQADKASSVVEQAQALIAAIKSATP